MYLKKSKLIPNQTIQIGGSKSISNRLLILNQLFGNLIINNLSTSKDTKLLENALRSDAETIDIQHAGTAMRFLTSYFALQENKTTILTGSERMKERPIGFLVEALRTLGAEIEYLENEGFPPLKIKGKKLTKSTVEIPAHISSQFISSLLLIGGKLQNGLQLKLTGKITSRPYLEMTLKILSELGIENYWEENTISVFPKKEISIYQNAFEVESDWSSASYFYSVVAVARENLNLKSFRNHSLQGDSVLKKIYWENFGVNTVSEGAENTISLYPETGFKFPEKISLHLNDCPDIAQTICVTAVALKIPFEITGLETLKIKETNRLQALKNELEKLGCETEINEQSIKSVRFNEPKKNISISTYDDHRMAMSFAPFSLIQQIYIENPEVVEKSYPEFWADLEKITERHVE